MSILPTAWPSEIDRRPAEPETGSLLALIDRALRSPCRLPGFPDELEARFEADTGARRVGHIRRMIVLGMAVFHLYDLTIFVTAPNIAPLNLALRLLFATPVAIAIFWAVGRVGARTREALCGLGMLSAALVPLAMFWLGTGPYLPMSTGVIWLTVIFANILLSLRFGWACCISGVIAAAGCLALGLHPDVDAGVAGILRLDMIVGIVFSLVAAHQMETANRRSYLLNLREILRSRQLAADNTALARLSTTDPLTGLANRRAFTQRLDALWRDAQAGRRFALLLIDVDHFKRFNDHYGHGAGDTCLCEISRLLRSRAGHADDLVSRYGGEEFALLLPDLDAVEAVALAERVRQALAARALPHASRGDGLDHVTVSVGVAASDEGAASPADLIEAADAALYRAKSAGRNQTGQSGGRNERYAEKRPAHPPALWQTREKTERRLRA